MIKEYLHTAMRRPRRRHRNTLLLPSLPLPPQTSLLRKGEATGSTDRMEYMPPRRCREHDHDLGLRMSIRGLVGALLPTSSEFDRIVDPREMVTIYVAGQNA
jgi:hypothetical protein